MKSGKRHLSFLARDRDFVDRRRSSRILFAVSRERTPVFKRPPTAIELEIETLMCLGEGATGIVYFQLDHWDYFKDSPDFEPLTPGRMPPLHTLFDHQDLLRKIQEINPKTRWILDAFPEPASRTETATTITYVWDNGTEKFTAQIGLSAPYQITYPP